VLYFITIFIGAFLLFQIQPLIAKLILPYFGGGAAVWTACLLFFQAFLLLGYSYAHGITQLNNHKKQVMTHVALLVISLFTLPIGLSSLSSFDSGQSPLWQILLLLSTSIGLPYLLLSSTGPLVQCWFSQSKNTIPYKLYSLSNFASLLALISFPFCFELLLTSEQQSLYWSVAYGIYIVIFIALALQFMRQIDNANADDLLNIKTQVSDLRESGAEGGMLDNSNVSKMQQWLWLGLSAIGVVLLVSTTNAMTQNIPPVPFLWILPLSLYLLTFIISFHSPKWYVRWYWLGLFIFTALIAVLMFFIGSQFDITSQVVIYSGILFSACMICHGELAKLKPHTDKLTWYYLLISLGGFLGSAVVAFVAQNLFQQFLEFPLAIIAVFLLLSLSVFIDKKSTNLVAKTSVISAVVCLVLFVVLNVQYVKTDIHSERNFYGILSVKEVTINNKKERRLIDGTTSHGTQSLAPNEQQTPLSYYRENTGIALALQNLSRANNIHAGFIGLGAGTLAAYGNSGDRYRFYELNPAVSDAAHHYFSYLSDSKAEIELVLGDGRVSLAKETDKGINHQFDILVIDAFSGDSIPQHLLTTEAVELYWQQLKDDGVLAIHISNSHLNLAPLMRGLAANSGKEIRYFNTKAKQSNEHETEWVWMTNNQGLLNSGLTKIYASSWKGNAAEKLLWTDNYSNLFSVLK